MRCALRSSSSAGSRPFVNRMEAALQQQRAEILRRHHHVEIEHSPEAAEDATLSGVRDMEARGADRDAAQLRAIEAALERIQMGAYGVCLECDEPISRKRLEALPAAERCIRCESATSEDAA